MTLRVFEAFAGYGSQSLALRNLGLDYEVVGISEIDKYAIQAYEALHGPTPNFGDISKIDPISLPDFDLMTYSFPCQDLSVAGQQKGLTRGQTRSGLLYECEKIIETKRPKYLLLENVKNLVSQKFKPQFEEWLVYLESLGYTNYWKVLNAKDYGIPQNRERVFVVSVLGEHVPYEFPSPQPLTCCLRDILDVEVEAKYLLHKPFKLVDKSYEAEFLHGHFEESKRIYSIDRSTMRTLTGKDRGQYNLLVPIQDRIVVGAQVEGLNQQNGRVYEPYGIVGTLDTMQGGHREPKVLQTTTHSPKTENDYYVRKLNPRECFRLMGLSETDIDNIQATGLSNTQQYKLAGNSIVVNVLEHLFENLFLKGEA